MSTRQIEIDLSKLLPHQRKLIKSKARKSCLICGRGAGKSYACASLALLYILNGRNVLIGGTTHDNLHDTLFAEIKRIAMEWEIYDLITWRESPMSLEIGNSHVWFGFYQAVESVRGYSRVGLIILDEMFLAPASILATWGPCCRNSGCKTRIVGATTPRQGSLWNITMSDPKCDWEIISAKSTDNTHITEEEMQLILSEIKTQEMYDQEILGIISTDLGNAAIIKLSEFPKEPSGIISNDTRVIAGFDAGEGVERDSSAFFKRRGNEVLEMWKLNGIDHEQCVQRIRESNRKIPIDRLYMDAAFSDYEYHTLKYEINCEQIHFAQAAPEEFRKDYANMRAYMWFGLADGVRHGLYIDGFDLSPELKRQMCSTTWLRDTTGRLLLVKKEDLRAALKMSPDIGDAAALTYVDRFVGDDPKIERIVKAKMEDKRAKALRIMGN